MRANTRVNGFFYNVNGTGMQFGEANLPWHEWQKRIASTMESGGHHNRCAGDLLVHDESGAIIFEVYDRD